MKKRILAMLMCLVMVLSLLPPSAFAAETPENVAKIGNTEYTSLQEAVNVGGEITLLADIALTEQVKIAEDKEITLDLNGKAITIPQVEGTSPYAIENKGNLTVKDSTGNGSITSRGVDNYGTMVMESGTIIDCDEGGSAIYNENGARFTMNGGTLKATYMGHSDNSTGGACLRNNGIAIFNGGTLDSISARTYAIISYAGSLTVSNVTMNAPRGVAIEGGTVEIKGGSFATFKSPAAAETYPTLYVYNADQITVSGGTFTVPDGEQPVWNTSSTTIFITGGSFTGNMAGKSEYHANSNITISGGSFSEPVPAKFCTEGVTFVVSNGMYTVADLSEAITSGDVEVAVPKAEDATSDVSDAVSAIATAIENNSSANVTLTVPVQDATVTFDTAAIRAMADGTGDVALTVENVTETATDLPEAVGEDAVVYDLTLTAGGNAVDFSTGSATVTIPNTTGLNSGVELWFRTAADGQWTKFEGTVTVTADTITFTTNHFSEWVAAQAAEVDPSAPVAITPSYEWYTSNPDADTYTISTVADLAGLGKLTANAVDGITEAATNFSGKTVLLANDLTFGENEYWFFAEKDADGNIVTSINYRIKDFAGTFDGQGHTIYGLKTALIHAVETPDSKTSLALFRTLYGTVKNLTVENVTITSVGGYDYLYPLVYNNAAGATVENCHSKNVTITATSHACASGLIGSNRSTVKNCSATNVTIYAAGGSDNTSIGGLFRGLYAGSTTIGCTATNISITVDNNATYIGGFSPVTNKNMTVTDCTVNGVKLYMGNEATSTLGCIGGFIGNVQNSTSNITYYTKCTVTGLEMVLTGTHETKTDIGVGGFVGSVANATAFTGCSAAGTIDASAADTSVDVGGFVGNYGWNYDYAITMDDCAADVDIVANGAAGGFVGHSAGCRTTNATLTARRQAYCTYTDCVATGNVTSLSAAAGGFVGDGDRGSFTECDASGSVSGVTAGGFWGKVTPNASKMEDKTLPITNCEATGTVLGTEAASGFIGTAVTTEGAIVAETTDMVAETIIVINNSTASPVVAGATSETAISTFVQDVTAEEYTSTYTATNVTESEEAFKPADEDVTLSMGNNGEIVIPEDTKLVDQNNKPVNVDPVAQIGETTYTSLADAFAAVNAGETITLLADLDLKDWTSVDVKKAIVLDGNGKTITGLTAPLVNNASADLEINNLTISGADIEVKSASGADNDTSAAALVQWVNGGTLTLNNVSVMNSTIQGDGYVAALVGFVDSTAAGVVVNGGTVSGNTLTAGGVVGAVAALTYADVTVNDVTVSANTLTSTSDNGTRPDKVGLVVGRPVADTVSVSATVDASNTATPVNGTAVVIGSLSGGNAVITGGSYPVDPTVTGKADQTVSVKEGFEVAQNEDGTYGIQEIPAAPAVELAITGFTLELEGMILIDTYAAIVAEGYDQAYIEANGGLLVWTANPGENATYENCAEYGEVREGLTYFEKFGYYYGQSNGIAAKKYADEYYMCIYLQLEDGSYVYTDVIWYSVQTYCKNQIGRDTTTEAWKTLCREMLEYGAAAQLAYGYNTEDLADAILKED